MIISGTTTQVNTDNVVEVIGEIVNQTNIALNKNADFMEGYIEAVGAEQDATFELFYQFGKRFEIAQTLVDYTKSPLTNGLKFPRLCLFTDIPEDHTDDDTSYTANLNIAIITATDSTLLSDERLEINFKPILLPIYKAFIESINNSRYVRGSAKYEKKDCYFWGAVTKDGNVSNDYSDYLDAIELNNMKLIINKKDCI